MKSKIFLSLLLITILPFTAYAVGTNTPGPEEETNENNVEIANDNGPYKILTPTAVDAGHIATTAYVKGAYNDAIRTPNILLVCILLLVRQMKAEQRSRQKRVTIYTTWGGNGTRQVELSAATHPQNN